MLECVVNISEGRDLATVSAIGAAAGADLLDTHTDPHHNRTVLTLVGEAAARAVAGEAFARLDLRDHVGVHPRIGVVDVVPFVPLAGSTMADAVDARDRFSTWAAETHGVPCFRYGTERTLPEVRRGAFVDLAPDTGPPAPHPTAGAIAVGARDVLVAYNAVLAEPDLALARRVAAEIRSPQVRALGLPVGDDVQVSMNLVAPERVGPAAVIDAIAQRAEVARCELVGLLPASVLQVVPEHRWAELDLGADRTIEARLARRQAP
ncbi:MAG: glutamate formiminotransferase [Actinobacteria bacterium]|nr:glutamate formiminotransferase [Actinomycetota bacterium]